MLEEKAGIDEKFIIYAHGSTKSASCSVCGAIDSGVEVNKALDSGVVRYCYKCSLRDKKSPVKPNVVFFGEKMPTDFKKAA